MFEASWGAIATILGVIIAAAALIFTQRQNVVMQRQKILIDDCRLAIRDLRRFRDLEALWSEELSRVLNSTPEAERKRMRGKLPGGNKIGDYGEPQRIDKLLARLG